MPEKDVVTLIQVTFGQRELQFLTSFEEPYIIIQLIFIEHLCCESNCRSNRSNWLQHARLPCPSPTPRACSNSCPSSWWCHPTISSSVDPFSSCLQSFPASGSFQMSQFFTAGGQSIGASASASILPMNIQDWFPLGWTGWITLQSKGPPSRSLCQRVNLQLQFIKFLVILPFNFQLSLHLERGTHHAY